MKRIARIVGIRKGCMDAYISAHRNIPESVIESLRFLGIHNYSLFLCEDSVFSYYETEQSLQYKEFLQNSFEYSKEAGLWEREIEALQYPKTKKHGDSGKWTVLEELWHFSQEDGKN